MAQNLPLMKLPWGVTFTRNYNGPLDFDTKFTSIQEWQNYIDRTDNLNVYDGQQIIIGEHDNTELYIVRSTVDEDDNNTYYYRLDPIAADVDLSYYATKDDVANIDLSYYATLSELEEAVGGIDLSYYATKDDVANIDLSNYATKDDVANIDLSYYATKDDVANIDLSYYATVSDLEEAVENIDLSYYATKDDLTSNKEVLKKDLTVMGVTVGNLSSGITITAGTSIEDILMQMLCKELFPKVSSYPSVTLKGVSKADVEVGTVYDDKQLGYTFSSGLFAGDNYTLSSTYTTTGVSVSSVSYFINDYTSYITQSTGKIADYDIASGSNIFKVTVTYSAATNNPVTNLGNEFNGAALIAAGTKSSTVTITGKYYTFYKLFKATDTINAPESSASTNGFTKSFDAPTQISIPTSDYTKIIIYTKQTLASKCDYDSGVLAQPWEIVNAGTYGIKLPNGVTETYNKYVLSTVEPWAAGKMTNLKFS